MWRLTGGWKDGLRGSESRARCSRDQAPSRTSVSRTGLRRRAEASGATGCSGVAVRRIPAPGAAVALVLALAGTLSGAGGVAHAQDVLVSNMGQTRILDILVEHRTVNAAQQFTTGDNEHGYRLDSVRIQLNHFNSRYQTVKVSIYSADASGVPDRELYVLTNPDSITNYSLLTFIAPAYAALDRQTQYFVVVESMRGSFSARATASNAEVAGSASGWSIADHRHLLSIEQGLLADIRPTNCASRSGDPASALPPPPPTAPPAPTKPTLVSSTNTTLTVEWTHPVDGDSPPILRNSVEYRAHGATEWQSWTVGETPVTRTTFRGLQANTRYEVRVRSHQFAGDEPVVSHRR